MKEISYTITDPEGLHARPAGMLVKEAGKYQSDIKIEKNGKSADAKRIFAIMGLGVKNAETIKITAEGEDEDTAIMKLEVFFKENL